MKESNLVPIKYIGEKELKYDNVADTAHTWTPGSICMVSPDVADKLLVHPMIWAVAADEAADAEKAAATAEKERRQKEEIENATVDTILDKSGTVIVAALPKFEDADIVNLYRAETSGKARKGVLEGFVTAFEQRGLEIPAPEVADAGAGSGAGGNNEPVE